MRIQNQAWSATKRNLSLTTHLSRLRNYLTDVSKSWHSINLPLHIWEWTKFSTKAPPVLVGWDPKICYALSNFNNAASSLPNSIPLQLPLLITHNSVWRHFNYFKTAQIDEAWLRQKCYALWQKKPQSIVTYLIFAPRLIRTRHFLPLVNNQCHIVKIQYPNKKPSFGYFALSTNLPRIVIY